MADGSKIEWTDATWQPITGCSVISPGCTNCYAMKLAGGRLRNHPSRAGLTEDSKAGPVWNGEVRFNEEWLDQPLRWRRPRTIFVAAHGDLFHESVPDEWVDRVFAVMAMAKQHRFQVLTKRSERMCAYLAQVAAEKDMQRWWNAAMDAIPELNNGWACETIETVDWPLPNVWLGTSVEDNDRRDRLDHLRETPAAVRFLSAEPLIGPLSIAPWLDMLDWVIVGGESGSGARPMHPEWVRTICGACLGTGTAFFLKQWGEWLPGEMDRSRTGPPHYGMPEAVWQDGTEGHYWDAKHPYYAWTPEGEPVLIPTVEDQEPFREKHGGPETLSVKVGKKRAGRMLDGREWNEMPA